METTPSEVGFAGGLSQERRLQMFCAVMRRYVAAEVGCLLDFEIDYCRLVQDSLLDV